MSENRRGGGIFLTNTVRVCVESDRRICLRCAGQPTASEAGRRHMRSATYRSSLQINDWCSGLYSNRQSGVYSRQQCSSRLSR